MDLPCILLGMEHDRLSRDLIDYLFILREQVQVALKPLLRDLDLTDAQVVALWQLSTDDGPITARQLSERLHCDPSTATSMVDRLERNGLVQRIPHPTDRRVKTLALTPRGCELRDRVAAVTVEQSPFARLDHDSQIRLHALLAEAAQTTHGESADENTETS